MKMEFILENSSGELSDWKAEIIGEAPKYHPYVLIRSISRKNEGFYMDKELERFAVNILGALKSKKLKETK